MGYSVSRLTLYAVLSAIEEDLRELVFVHLAPQKTTLDLLGRDLALKARERLEKDFGPSEKEPSLDQMLFYIDFGDLFAILNTNSILLPQDIAKYIKGITAQLSSLIPIRNRVAHHRPLNFDDLPKTLDIAEDLIKKPEVPWDDLKDTLRRLNIEPSFVLGLKIPSYTLEEVSNKHNLPIPDFDETGFLGRKQQVNDLIKLCLGPYPVITIVGEGGIGKTALALKAAYDILDLPDCPFEAVVWTSSKTTQLTPHDIIKIEGAICDSLGMFQHTAEYLAGKGVEHPIEEVVSYLKEFRILLILDNLETVLDNRIRYFIESLPSGSKILITSRIGLGAFEFPVRLRSMDQNEAIQLLRALAKIRGASDLVKASNTKLANYCNRMKNNPGFIKWFVSAVQAGRRPEEVLDQPDVFLDFCMSNVYNYLSEGSRTVLRTMLCLSAKHSQAELAFLNNMEAIDLQRALHELLRTNMVIMSSIPTGSSFESQYSLSDLARAYLAKHHPADPKEYERLLRQKRQLTAVGEQVNADLESDPYSFYSITMRSKSDIIVAKYLLDALKQANNRNYNESEKWVSKARSLAPEYFEVHRVDALVKTLQNNYSAAQTSYESAIELEPQSAPLRKWYGSFLMRYMDDTEGALQQFLEAANLDPTACDTQIEMSRAFLYKKDFDEAFDILQNLVKRLDLPAWKRRKIYDLYLQYFYRKADQLLAQRDPVGALSLLQHLKIAYQECAPELIDNTMKRKLRDAIQLSRSCAYFASDEINKNKATELAEWLTSVSVQGLRFSDYKGNAVQLNGKIIMLKEDSGFLLDNIGKKIFFRRSSLSNPEEWNQLKLGNRVTFSMGRDERGSCAVEISVFQEENGLQSHTDVSPNAF